VKRWGCSIQLLAISGGADSVALLRAMVDLSPNRELLHVAHFNHGWRGAESDADEIFVRELCHSLGLRLEVGRVTESTGEQESEALHHKIKGLEVGPKTEESARMLRYDFLSKIALKVGARYVLTAHTASDRVETMLHNLCRGTGLAGVCTPGLLRSFTPSGLLVRPLIGCFRWQVEQYLSDLKQPVCCDSSNDDQSYRRNYIRATVLPVLRAAYGTQVDQRLLSFSLIAEEALESQRHQADQYWREATRLSQEFTEQCKMRKRHVNAICVPNQQLLPSSWPIVQLAIRNQWHLRGWALKAITKRHWERIRSYWADAAESSAESAVDQHSRKTRPRVTLPGPIRLEFRKGWLTLEPLTLEPLSE